MSKFFWTDFFAKTLIRLLSKLPSFFYNTLAELGGRVLDRKKGKIARAALKLTQPNITPEQCDAIARKSSTYSLTYLLSLPRLRKTPYQLHNLDVMKEAVAEDRGAVVISLHMGPPDIGTLAAAEHGFPANTLIGAGKQSPLANSLGRHALEQAGIDFIQRGDPTAVFKSIKQKKMVFLYSDLRSREMPVTFFGQETSAPATGVMTAQLLKAPILFHYCTMKNGEWQLHFERFEPELTGSHKSDAANNLQRLIHKMEEVISQHPELWVWHYDRFKLKKKLNN
ncbi:lysophospholipid acyltransferase family protein [Endozoicomonas sp. OPT23]|uniref:lysophospholipid acyltransferase family protein n=1 Tax=Endozoicomonas sp. OPT23 TaxID=2072845 RepID=UPI0018914755|nr:lysophospholipid acyltransferase family protein [Endozoicomonas sp. OPT23]